MIDFVQIMVSVALGMAFLLALGWTIYYGVVCFLSLFEDWDG